MVFRTEHATSGEMETKIPDEADLLNVAVRVAILINLTTN